MFSESQQIGIYKLIRKLGRGGFGEVWLAEKTSEGFRKFTKKVAVKLPLAEQIDFHAIEQEATLWEQVSGHANVLPIIDADIFNGQVVIVSEYAEGGSLAEKLEKDGRFPVKKAVETTIGILKGLEFLHNKQIIHRDIKPQNILLQNDTPRLADFGISRAMQTTTVSSKIVGTDAYMSPEALDGKRTVQTDVWSVGVVLYELLKDDLPFPQEHPSERMFAILMKEFEPLSMEIPYKLRDVVNKALAKKPEERYLSASDMHEDLTHILAEMSHSSYAETKTFPKDEIAEVRQIIDSGAQNNPFETVKPIRLKELDEYARTEAAVTQSSLSTEPIKTISSRIPPTPPTEVVSFVNAGKSKWQTNLRFVLYGGVPLILISVMAVGYVMFSSSKSSVTLNKPADTPKQISLEPTIPSNFDTKLLVKGTMSDFADALEKEDFKTFREKASKDFQDSFTDAQLKSTFQPYITQKSTNVPILRKAAAKDAKFSPAPSMREESGNYILVANGTTEIDDENAKEVKFEMEWVWHDSAWKLLKIKL